MRGLRCDPALLGWTRLLDEWVVGPSPSASDLQAERRALAEAATRVRSFAFAETTMEPTEPLPDGTLRFELQGCVYRVAVALASAESLSALRALVDPAFRAATAAATVAAHAGEVPVAVLAIPVSQVTPALWVDASRQFRCSAFAFSFHDENRGRLLFVRALSPVQALSS